MMHRRPKPKCFKVSDLVAKGSRRKRMFLPWDGSNREGLGKVPCDKENGGMEVTAESDILS